MLPSKVLPNIYIQLHTKYELLFTVKLYFHLFCCIQLVFLLDLSLFIRFIAYLKSVKYFPYQQKEEMKSQAINKCIEFHTTSDFIKGHGMQISAFACH